MKHVLFGIVLLFATAGICSAQTQNDSFQLGLSGNNFLSACDENQTQPIQNTACTLYVHGVIDGVRYQWSIDNLGKPAQDRLFCMGEGVTLGQEKRVVLQYVKTHPATQNYDTISLIFMAMIDAFPCAPLAPATAQATPTHP